MDLFLVGQLPNRTPIWFYKDPGRYQRQIAAGTNGWANAPSGGAPLPGMQLSFVPVNKTKT